MTDATKTTVSESDLQAEEMTDTWPGGPWKKLSEEGQGGRRWTETMVTVVRHRAMGETWAVEWERGLTESQEDSYDTPPYRVESYEVVIPATTETRWRKLATPKTASTPIPSPPQ